VTISFSVVKISGRRITRVEPALKYTIRVLALSAEHRHNLQLDPTFVPFPNVNERLSSSFRLPVEHQVLCDHLRILPFRLLTYSI
jgi:hypothetical protein